MGEWNGDWSDASVKWADLLSDAERPSGVDDGGHIPFHLKDDHDSLKRRKLEKANLIDSTHLIFCSSVPMFLSFLAYAVHWNTLK